MLCIQLTVRTYPDYLLKINIQNLLGFKPRETLLLFFKVAPDGKGLCVRMGDATVTRREIEFKNKKQTESFTAHINYVWPTAADNLQG